MLKKIWIIFLVSAIFLGAKSWNPTIYTFRASAKAERMYSDSVQGKWTDRVDDATLVVLNGSENVIKLYHPEGTTKLFITRTIVEDSPDSLAPFNAQNILRFKCIDRNDHEWKVILFLAKSGNDLLLVFNLWANQETEYFLRVVATDKPLS